MSNSMQMLINNQMRKEGKEVIDWTFYDGQLLTGAGATNTKRFFQNTIGSAGGALTNMKSSGMLPNPQSFACFVIGCKIFNADGTPFFFAGGAGPTVHPLATIFAKMFWRFNLEPSVEYEGHGAQFFNAPDYMNDTATTLGVDSITDGKKFYEVHLQNPILIPSQRAFSIEVTYTAPAEGRGYTAANTIMMLYMKGILSRNS